MPIYQFWCDDCQEPHEIMMRLSVKDRYDKGHKSVVNKTRCPECDKILKYLIAPVRLSSFRCTITS